MALSAQTLVRLGVPRAKARAYLPYLTAAMREARITTKPRAEMFLAQLWHESAALKYFEEIASGAAYEGRRSLGNTQRGDGRRFKGRGPIQLTGRTNYRAAGKALGLDLEGNPKQAATPKVGFRVAAWYWTSRSLNQLADRGDFREITRRINGGYNGWNDRVRWLKRMRSLDVRPGDPSLSRGDKGKAVVVLTRRLSYVRSPETSKRYLDGQRDRFDVETVRALKRFQGDHGLEQSGKFGPETEKALARAVDRRKRVIARRKKRGRRGLEEPLPPDQPRRKEAEKPRGGTGSGQLLEELETVESREDRLLDVLLRRGVRLERLIGDAEQHERVVTLDELDSVKEGLARFESAIDDVQARIAGAEAAAVPASAPGQTRASPAGGYGATGEGQGASSADDGKTATKHAPAEGASAAAHTPGNGSPGGVASGGSPEGGASGSSSGTTVVDGGGRGPTPPDPGYDGGSSPSSAVGPDPPSLGNGTPAQAPPQAAPSAPSPGQPATAQLTFEELAAKIREHDAESDRLRGVIRHRLLALEEKAGGLDGGTNDRPEPSPPTPPRGAVYRVKSPPMKSPQIRSLQRLLNRRFAKWRVNYRIKEHGAYDVATRDAMATVLYGLGIDRRAMADGLTPELRVKVRKERLTAAEKRRKDERKDWRLQLRKKHEDGGHVAPLLAKIIKSDWGFNPGHDGVDLICKPNATIYALCDAKVIDVRASGWWGKAPSGDVSKGDGIIQLECLTNVGPFKKGMHFGYGHAEHAVVKEGQTVNAGDPLGKAGLAVAWHIHFMANGGGTNQGRGDRDPMPFVRYAMKRNH